METPKKVFRTAAEAFEYWKEVRDSIETLKETEKEVLAILAKMIEEKR